MTPEQIEQARMKLRERVLNDGFVHHEDHRGQHLGERCPILQPALDAFVAFERAVEAVSQSRQWFAVYGGDANVTRVLKLCEAELDRIIRETLGTEGG